jgi:hypothetical protein
VSGFGRNYVLLGGEEAIATVAAAMAAGRYGLKRSGRLWWVEFFGILHCVQDDGSNLQRQVRMQRQVRSWGQQKLAMADADARASAQLGLRDGLGKKRISPLRSSQRRELFRSK